MLFTSSLNLLIAEMIFLSLESFAKNHSEYKSIQGCDSSNGSRLHPNYYLSFPSGTPKPDLTKPDLCYLFETKTETRTSPLNILYLTVRETERSHKTEYVCAIPSNPECCDNTNISISIDDCLVLWCHPSTCMFQRRNCTVSVASEYLCTRRRSHHEKHHHGHGISGTSGNVIAVCVVIVCALIMATIITLVVIVQRKKRQEQADQGRIHTEPASTRTELKMTHKTATTPPIPVSDDVNYSVVNKPRQFNSSRDRSNVYEDVVLGGSGIYEDLDAAVPYSNPTMSGNNVYIEGPIMGTNMNPDCPINPGSDLYSHEVKPLDTTGGNQGLTDEKSGFVLTDNDIYNSN